jgi:hypothetical protein
MGMLGNQLFTRHLVADLLLSQWDVPLLGNQRGMGTT